MEYGIDDYQTTALSQSNYDEVHRYRETVLKRNPMAPCSLTFKIKCNNAQIDKINQGFLRHSKEILTEKRNTISQATQGVQTEKSLQLKTAGPYFLCVS